MRTRTGEKVFREPVNNPSWFLKKVEVKESPTHGLGVFATEKIEKHEMFESCPVILFHKGIVDDYHRLYNTNRHIIDDYVFKWKNGCLAIALGYGSLYNHSNDHANATCHMTTDHDPRISFTAKRDIAPGEEIFHHYRRGRGKLMFTDAGTCFEDNRMENDHMTHLTLPGGSGFGGNNLR